MVILLKSCFSDGVYSSIRRHEHLYKRIKENVIPSDEFADNPVGNARLLLGSRVILCTLSMLATHRLVSAGFTRLVPVETVFVDEASQIELGDYLPLLSRFGRDIKKLVFVGDDKQRECLRDLVGLVMN